MNLGVSGPLPEGLAVEPKQNTERAPKKGQGHVGHDGWNVAIGNDPWGDELAEAIPPDVLVDGDGDEYASGHRLVGVNGIRRRNSGKRSDLDACTSISDNNYSLPVP